MARRGWNEAYSALPRRDWYISHLDISVTEFPGEVNLKEGKLNLAHSFGKVWAVAAELAAGGLC